MPWHDVEVVNPPQLETLIVKVHPPSYTAWPASEVDRHFNVLEGTGIEISGTASEPLSAAQVLVDGAEPMAATIKPNTGGNAGREFQVAPEQWVASKSGEYRVELAGADGIAGVAGRWNIRVRPDTAPTVAWQQPAGDLYVTATAIVPIAVTINDDLAIHVVELLYELSDQSASERDNGSAASSIEIYRGLDQAAPHADHQASDGERRVVEYRWDLAALQLSVGSQLEIYAAATDYRPGTGRTKDPRQITIITLDELHARLADRQAQLMRLLEQALNAQRTTRDDVRRLDRQQRDGALTGAAANSVGAADLAQRRVGRMLTDSREGMPAVVAAILAELEMNRVTGSELRASLERLLDEVEKLSRGPLGVAERELAAVRKLVDDKSPRRTSVDNRPIAFDEAGLERLSSSLASAGAAQDEVIAALDRLLAEYAGEVDQHRLAQQLSELRRDQVAHQQSTSAEIGTETLPLQLSELSRSQRERLEQAAEGQNVLAQRLERIEQALEKLAANQSGRDASTRAPAAAVELARRLGIGAKMQETVRDLEANRVAQALAREAEIAADLQQILDALRERDERGPDQLARGLRAAEEQLATLRQQLSELRQQVAQMEQQPASSQQSNTLAQLHTDQRSLRGEIQRLSRQLDELQAKEASQSTQRAANQLDGGQRDAQQQSASPRPRSSREMQQAEQELERAARELAARHQQAEDDLALAFVRRFQAELGQMVERQQRVVSETIALDAQLRSNESTADQMRQPLAKLAGEEKELTQLAKEHREVLSGLGAVRVSLEDAERRLAAAAELLDDGNSSQAAQRAERHALARLEGMLQAFSQTNADASNSTPPPGGSSGQPADQPPQRRPTFELLEVKMLRMLQADLNQKTQAHQARLASDSPPNEGQRAELLDEARELAAEQGRLAELVQGMLTRDNDDGDR
jgi:hypothetical protein